MTGSARWRLLFDLHNEVMPDFPQPLTLMSSTTMGLSGMVNPNSFRYLQKHVSLKTEATCNSQSVANK